MALDGRGDGKELGRVEGVETVIKINHVSKETIFNMSKNEEQKCIIVTQVCNQYKGILSFTAI